MSQNQNRKEPRIDLRDNKEIIPYYKMITPIESSFQCEDIFRGVVHNISRNGILFEGNIPAASWISHLEDGQITIGFNIQTPDTKIKLLGRVRWAQLKQWPTFYRIGAQFENIDSTNNDKLKCLLIKIELQQRKKPETRRIKRMEELLINPTFTKG